VHGDELGQGVGEADLFFQRMDRTALGCRSPVWQEDGEGVQVGAVYTRDVGVRYDNVWEVAEGLETVGEADR
jgi:hypothetical protein